MTKQRWGLVALAAMVVMQFVGRLLGVDADAGSAAIVLEAEEWSRAKADRGQAMSEQQSTTCTCSIIQPFIGDPFLRYRAGCPIHDPKPDNLPYPFCWGNPLYAHCAGHTSCARSRACND